VVPRDPSRGEHVDDHQQLFARRVGAAGLVEVAETEDALVAALVTGAYLPRQRGPIDDGVPPGVFRIGEITEELVAQWGSEH
jgi:hypothetical protein